MTKFAWNRPATCGACTNREAQERLRERLGADYQVATIGPAGERLVRYATISHDGRHAGRGGSGAVLGAKNIKAIAVRGSQRVEWAHPKELVELAKRLSEKSFGPATAKYRELGTATNLLAFNRLNVLPTRNFQQGSFAGAQAISPEQLSVARERTRASCAACTIGCEHLYGMQNGDGNVRLEYENLFALGPLCGIDDPEVVLAACQRCDELGLDTISAGGTIAFAMECAERGYIDEPWLRFGDGAALLRALELIVSGEGIGRLLAEGSRRMALEVGHDSIAFAPQVKGLEIPGYDPRGLQTMALGFRRGHARGRSQSLGRVRSRFLRGRRSPQCGPGERPAGDRNRKQSGADGLADPVQIPARRVQRLLRRGGRDAAAGHRLGCHGRRAARDGGADRHGQEAIQHPGRLDARRRHAARRESCSDASARRRPRTAFARAAGGAGRGLQSARGWTPEGWLP